MRRNLIVLMMVLAGVVAPARAVPPAVGGALASDNVDLVATIPDLGAVGYRIIGDTMYTSGAQGVRIFDLSLGIPVPLGALELPHFSNEDVDTNGEILLVSEDYVNGDLYVIDVRNRNLPLIVGTLRGMPASHTVSCINACTYAWLAGSDKIHVLDLRTPSSPKLVGTFDVPGSTHDVNVDAAGVAWVSSGFGRGGLFGYDTTDPVHPTLVAGVMDGQQGAFNDDFTIHNSLRPDATLTTPAGMADGDVDPGELLLVTEEDWLFPNACANDGQFQTGWYHTVNGAPVVERLDGFNLGSATAQTATQKRAGALLCSSHYFAYADGIAAVGWYEHGTRFLDVSNPRDIRQIGYFMPAATSTFHVAMHRGYIYTFDVARGMDVLRLTTPTGARAPEVIAPAFGAPSRALAPHPRFGWACRLPA